MRLISLFVIMLWAVIAHAETLDGITIIELEDNTASKIIGGSGGKHIVTFVSGLGTYAAVGAGQSRCVAWAAPGSYTGTSITFGLSPESYSVKLQPRLCQPFSLRLEGGNTVRVEANNKPFSYVPDPNAKPIQYSRRRTVLLRVPLQALDWGLPPFARHDVKGVRLGPVPFVTGQAGDHTQITVNDLVHSATSGSFKSFKAIIKPGSGQSMPGYVLGWVAAAEVTGWPWDALIGLRYNEKLPQLSTSAAFENAVQDRYGPPSPGDGSLSDTAFYWLYDMQGKQRAASDPSDCARSLKLWQNQPHSGGALNVFNSDIGPWACALIMKLQTNPGTAGTVSSYISEVTSGYAFAINHFLRRLREMDQMRAKVGTVQSYQPTL